MIAFIALINYFGGNVLAIIVIIFYYSFFFRFEHKLPLLFIPFLSNVAFGYIPLYISYTVENHISLAQILLALFLWISVIAHDYAHSVHADSLDTQGIQTYSKQLGARTSAIVSLIGYLIACILGTIFWLIAKQPPLFFTMLMLSALYILYLEIQLIKKPSSEQAIKFYISGFLFFLLPCLGLIIDQILR